MATALPIDHFACTSFRSMAAISRASIAGAIPLKPCPHGKSRRSAPPRLPSLNAPGRTRSSSRSATCHRLTHVASIELGEKGRGSQPGKSLVSPSRRSSQRASNKSPKQAVHGREQCGLLMNACAPSARPFEISAAAFGPWKPSPSRPFLLGPKRRIILRQG